MKRGGPLVRRTALSRGTTELKRTGTLKRSAMPKATTKNPYEQDLDRARPALHQRSKGRCEIRLPGCQGNAVHPHHRKLRSRGGTNDLDNLLDACERCHDRAHSEVELATALGLQVPSWMPVGPVSEVFAAIADFCLAFLDERVRTGVVWDYEDSERGQHG